ncbi:MAG: DNA translocase FtsK 4TM domain-containing protein, partial [Chloroflexia bacterium]
MGKRRTIRKHTGRGQKGRTASRRRTMPRARRAEGLKLEPRLQRELIGLAFLALAVVALISFVSGAPAPGASPWRGIVRYWFGWGGFLVPLGLGALGVLILRGEIRNEPWLDWNDILGGALLFLAVLGLLGLPSAREVVLAPGSGGGILGHAVASLLVVRLQLRALGSLLLLLLVALVGSMLAFDVRVRHLVAGFRAVGKGIAWLAGRFRRRPSPIIRVSPEVPVRPARRQPEPEEEEEEEEAEEEPPLPRIIGRTEPRGGAITMAARPSGEWRFPPLDLLEVAGSAEVSQAEIRRQARIIEETL